MEFITGEKFQRIADISIITPKIKEFHTSLGDAKICLFLDDFTKVEIPYILHNARIIFVYTHILDRFFSYIYPSIQQKFILITHNSDIAIEENYRKYLNESKIFSWYGQNCEIFHPKLTPVPIGIANAQWDHGNEAILRKVIEIQKKKNKKKDKVYSNFLIRTNPTHRRNIYNVLKKNSFVITKRRSSFFKYLLELGKYKYCVVPKGNGQDCHRLWESLYLGTIPIIDNRNLFHNFTTGIWEGTPIIFIDDWKELSKEFLVENEKKMNIKKDWKDKLDFRYWKQLIEKNKTLLLT